MIITLIADTHFSNPKKFSRITKEGYNSRFLDQLSVFSLIPDNTDVLIHLGDLFHNKFRLEFDIYDKVYNEINELDIPTKILVGGNHDFSSYWREPTLFPLTKIMNVFTTDYGYLDVDSGSFTVRFHCIPYPDVQTQFFNNIELAINNKIVGANILLSHIGIKEGVVGASNIYLDSEFYLHDLAPDMFDFVFLGHYHKHQSLHYNTYYIGSPLQQDFGETGEKKGIMCLDLTPDGNSVKFINSISTPQFIKYEVSSERDLYKLTFNCKDFYKVELNGAFDRQVLDELASKYNIIYEGGGVKRTGARIEINEDTDIITEYCKLNNVGEDYIEIGKSFI